MIVVRNVFQLKFGKAREALAVMKEGIAIQRPLAAEGSARLLTDVTGRHYTLVLEMTLETAWSGHSISGEPTAALGGGARALKRAGDNAPAMTAKLQGAGTRDK